MSAVQNNIFTKYNAIHIRAFDSKKDDLSLISPSISEIISIIDGKDFWVSIWFSRLLVKLIELIKKN
ncbi:hypothetical protein [Bacillus sp. 123MFChir2]|uniref:hypothetical protein n=1 Tax=Bacillus sp. 123MFChir2 TaxID=1169144 RepID=UPI00036C15D7|nr:hypothetical protein [Bacillus sp. 123MFChir2]